MVECGLATTSEEVEAIQRLRYDVYVDELGRYRSKADHERRVFVEPEDDHSWLLFARDGDEMIATARVTWGGAGFSERQVRQYELQPWLDELPAEVLAVGERAAVRASHRGTQVIDEMFKTCEPLGDAHGVEVAIGCCEPHLLALYISMGQRPYASRNINSEEAGYLIPLVAFPHEAEALRGRSRLRGPDELPACVEAVLRARASVTSESLAESDDYWLDIRDTLDQLHEHRVSAFDGFSDDEATRCITRSNTIECAPGDRLFRHGGAARNMFVVLSGHLEVRDDGQLIGVLGPGDVFGEMAFLLEQPRTFDVDAVTDARVLSLSEGTLRKMIAADPPVAAKLLLNVSKMLCSRLIRAERTATTPTATPDSRH